MSGKDSTDAKRATASLPREFFDGEVEYEIVEGELLPRGPLSRPWDPFNELWSTPA